MVQEPCDSATREQRVDEVIAAYLCAVQAGQRPDRRQWLARYPEVAAELEAFADQEQFDRVVGPLLDQATGKQQTGSPIPGATRTPT